jgi:hypothetical protein
MANFARRRAYCDAVPSTAATALTEGLHSLAVIFMAGTSMEARFTGVRTTTGTPAEGFISGSGILDYYGGNCGYYDQWAYWHPEPGCYNYPYGLAEPDGSAGGARLRSKKSICI